MILKWTGCDFEYCGDLPDILYDQTAFSSCNGYYGKILTQLRLGLSPLREHLFKYQISDNPFCPSCCNEIESVTHFLLFCTSYDAARAILFDEIVKIVGLNVWNNIDNNDKIDHYSEVLDYTPAQPKTVFLFSELSSFFTIN